jgi:hypothetical protein
MQYQPPAIVFHTTHPQTRRGPTSLTHPYAIPPYKLSNEASKTFWLGQMEPWMGEILRAARLRNLDRSQAFYTSVLA